jgi:hypothetical protein
MVWCDIYSPDEHLACWLVVCGPSRKAAEHILREVGVHRLKLGAPSKPPFSEDLTRLAVSAPERVVYQVKDGVSPAGTLS